MWQVTFKLIIETLLVQDYNNIHLESWSAVDQSLVAWTFDPATGVDYTATHTSPAVHLTALGKHFCEAGSQLHTQREKSDSLLHILLICLDNAHWTNLKSTLNSIHNSCYICNQTYTVVQKKYFRLTKAA